MQSADLAVRLRNLTPCRKLAATKSALPICLLLLFLLLWGCSPGDEPATAEEDARTAVLDLFGNEVGIASHSSLPNGEDHTDFGSVPQGVTPPVRSFTVRNAGDLALTLDAVNLPAGFSLVTPPAPAVEPGETTVFAVQMDTQTVGTPSGEVSLSSNDGRQNPFVFTIRGAITERIVAMTVLGNGTEIDASADVSPAHHTDFGVTQVGGPPILHAFTIRNLGNVPLTLDAVDVPDGFELAFPPDDIVMPGADTIFFVRMLVDSVGIRSGEVRVETREEAPTRFSFPIRGVAAEPSSAIAVLGNEQRIPDGNIDVNTSNHTYFVDDSSGFPTAEVTFDGNDIYGRATHSHVRENGRGSGTTSDVQNLTGGSLANGASSLPNSMVTRSFTILNESNDPLTLDRIDVPAGFILLTESVPILAPGESADIEIQLDTAVDPGVRIGILSIASSEIAELPYTFAIMGIVHVPQMLPADLTLPPELRTEPSPPASRAVVFGASRYYIPTRSSIPSLDNFTDLGAVLLGEAPIRQMFTVQNTGNLPLTLGPVTVPEGFTLVFPPRSPLERGERALFEVRLESSAVGINSGLISFQHDGIDPDPYTFAIQGVVREPGPFLVFSATTSPTPGNAPLNLDVHTDFGRTPQDHVPIVRTFTIRNDGELPLTIDAVHVPEGFTLVNEPANTLPPGAATGFEVRLDTQIVGNKTGFIEIHSNDPLQTVAAYSIHGVVTDSKPVLTLLSNGVVIPPGYPAPELNYIGGMAPGPGALGVSMSNQTYFSNQTLWQEPSLVYVYTIQNDGTLPLEIGTISVSDGFVIESLPASTVAPGATSELRIGIDNAVEGGRSSLVSIHSNDDDHDPYTFGISGYVGRAQAPPFSVQGNLRSIASLSTTPAEDDHTDFGTHARNADASAATRTFTILNDGNSPLRLGPVNVPAGFVLVREPPSVLQGNTSTSFEVRLDTSWPGTRKGAIFFSHEGNSLSPFAFQIQGTVNP